MSDSWLGLTNAAERRGQQAGPPRIVALAFAFLGWLALGRGAVQRQEATPETAAAPASTSA